MSKNAWSPGRRSRSANVCGCGLQRSPEIALIASTCSEPSSKSTFIAAATTSFSRTPGRSSAVDLLVRRVDDPGGVVEQRELVGRLELPRLEHHRLRVGEVQALALEREQRGRVGHVDPERLLVQAPLAQLVVDHRRERVGDARLVGHRAAHRRDPRAPARLGQPGAVELVVARGRAEVPEDRVLVAEDEREADVLVALPRPDRRARHVAEVVRVEEQEGAEVRGRKRRFRPLEPGLPQTVEVDPLLPVDRHRRSARRDVHPVSLPGAMSRCSAILHTWPL